MNSEISSQIQSIIDSIDELIPSDRKGWERAQAQLADLADAPSEQAPLWQNMTVLCGQAFGSIAQGRGVNTMQIIDGASKALAAAKKFAEDPEQGASQLDAALQLLDVFIPEEEAADMPQTDSDSGDSNTSDLESVDSEKMAAEGDETSETADAPDGERLLNDLAALLVQLEPDDSDGWARVATLCERIDQHSALPDLVRREIAASGRQVAEMGGDSELDPAELLETIGEQVEDALDLLADGPISFTPVNDASPEPLNESAEPEIDETDSAPTVPVSTPAPTGADSVAGSTAPDTTDHMPDDADEEILVEFIGESKELITDAEEALLTLETDPDDTEAVGKVFRAFHTVKGTAAFLELNLVSEMGHHAESLLSRVRDQEIRYSGGYADLALRSLDMIKELVLAVQAALEGDALLKPEGYDGLMEILQNPEASGVGEEDEAVPQDAPRIGDLLVAQGKVPREDLEEALAASPGTPVGEALVKANKAKLADVGQALRTQKTIKGPKRRVEASVRVSTGRLDRLIDSVGEMVIAYSMIAQDDVVNRADNHELLKKVSHTGKIVRELQDLSMSMRMIPLKSTFQKMTRLVRDLSRKVGKNVSLVTEGEDTEIDRNLVDVINDPLVHMIRNSVDHGVESPEERRAAGKPEVGTVRLSAYHSAGAVVVEIEDDGKGLDREAILAKAKERGLVADDRTPSDREIYNMIFEPGFSTAAAVTDVSGRGVGMDVVRRNIESLRGQVDIQSTRGQGTVFKMSLPLTLAIIDGMIIRIGQERLIIPTISIVRSIEAEAKDISTVFNRGEVLSLPEGLIPLMQLREFFDLDHQETENGNRLVVVVEEEHTRAGLIIDELIGRQQVVIKSLGETMRNIPAISGGAIMPNGRVGLILDVGQLVRLASKAGDDHQTTKGASDESVSQ